MKYITDKNVNMETGSIFSINITTGDCHTCKNLDIPSSFLCAISKTCMNTNSALHYYYHTIQRRVTHWSKKLNTFLKYS